MHTGKDGLARLYLLSRLHFNICSEGQVQVNPGSKADKPVALAGFDPVSGFCPAEDPAGYESGYLDHTVLLPRRGGNDHGAVLVVQGGLILICAVKSSRFEQNTLYGAGIGYSVDMDVKDIHEYRNLDNLLLQESVVKDLVNEYHLAVCRTYDCFIVFGLDPEWVAEKPGNKGGSRQPCKGGHPVSKDTADKGNKAAEEDKRKPFFRYGKFRIFHTVFRSTTDVKRKRHSRSAMPHVMLPVQRLIGDYFFGARAIAIVPVRIISFMPMGRRISSTALILDSEPVISTE